MDASLPKHCMVMVYFAKGLKLKQLLNDEWYGVMTGSETEETTHSIYVERLGSKLRLRNCPGTEFGSIDQVIEDAQRLLGENPEQVRFALYAAGLSTPKQTQKVFENKLVGSSWGCDSVHVSSSLDYLPALGSLPQKALDETIAVFRTVIDQWDDETFPNDDHDDYFIDKCEGCIFIVPEFSSEDYSKDDIALFRRCTFFRKRQ